MIFLTSTTQRNRCTDQFYWESIERTHALFYALRGLLNSLTNFLLQALSNLHLKNPDYEEEPTDLEVGVSICDLRKVFKVCESFVMY